MKNEDDQPVVLTHIDSNSNNDLNNGSLTSPVSLAEPFAANLNVVSQVDVPPNGGYGWVCTACVFLINAHTWGVNSAWGIFLSHYLQNSTFPGTSQFSYAIIGGLGIACACLVSPAVNVSMRLYGTTVTLTIGTILVFLSLFTASYASRIWHLFLSQAVCFGCGMGFTYIPATAVLPQWFSTRRSLAVGIAASGVGFGGVAYNLIAGAAAQSVGLPWTYRILALCSLAVNGVCSLLIRDRNKLVKPKQDAFDWRELGHIEVIFVIVWGFLSELGYVVLFYSLPHYATTIGLSQSQGSVAGALLNVGIGVGRPLVGWMSDRWGRINMAALMTASCGICCLALWVPAKDYGTLIAFALLAGFGAGNFWGTVSSVMAEVVGLQRLPTAFGVMMIVLASPTTFAEPIALEMTAVSGYKAAQIFVGFMFIGAAGSVWFLRSWKITEIEEKAKHEEVGDFEWGLSRFHAGRAWLEPRKLIKRCRV
ncbi:hypothetical protein LTS08_007106 [Lithohypha guttulata]|nr:hypothetical protein LTS08_007106 [Lithohypha guttulata]